VSIRTNSVPFLRVVSQSDVADSPVVFRVIACLLTALRRSLLSLRLALAPILILPNTVTNKIVTCIRPTPFFRRRHLPATIMPPQEQVGDNAEFKSYPGLKKSDYEHRMHNASLARLDISQLRAEMEYYGLDTTGIRFKVTSLD